MKIQSLAVLLFLLITVNEAKEFAKCELVTALRDAGMDGYHGYSLENWICTAYHESGYNSAAVGRLSRDGSTDYGIFQINSRWWCSNGRDRTVNGCGTSCRNFLDDDISDDIECAKRIVRDPNRMGAWVAWTKHCRGRDLSRWTAGC